MVEFGFWQLKCDKCDFATHFEAGLKSHAGKKHKKGKDNGEIVFPKQCTLCHSYKLAQFKFDHCDFVGGDEIDMEVHVARTHEENFECGLCDYEGKDIKALDIHLKTCETYQCGICSEKLSQLPDIKMHFEEKHETCKNSYYPNGVRHIKPSRENKDVYNNKFHSYSDLFSEH